jgi:hypothetical protein
MPTYEKKLNPYRNVRHISFRKYGFSHMGSYFIYLFLIVFIFPLIDLLLPQFRDYNNYINNIRHAGLMMEEFARHILHASPLAIFDQPLWPAILKFFHLFLAAPVVLGIVVSLSITMMALSLSKINKKPWLTLCLILIIYPLAMKYLFQYRQGFAMSVYMWGYSIEGRKGIILRVLSPFIHYGMYLLIGVEAAYLIFSYFDLSKRLLIVFSVLPGIIVTAAVPLFIKFTHAQHLFRRYTLYAPHISGLGALAWGLYGVAIIVLSKPKKEVALALAGIYIFVFSQFYIDIGNRLLAMFLPFIIISFSRMDEKRILLLCLTIMIGLAFWVPIFLDPSHVFYNW